MIFLLYQVALSNSSLKKTFYCQSNIQLEKGERIIVKFKGKKTIGYVLGEVNKSFNKDKDTLVFQSKLDGKSFIRSWLVDALNDAALYYNTPVGKLFDLCFPKGIENYFVEKVKFNNPLYGFEEFTLNEFINKFGERKLQQFLKDGTISVFKDFKLKAPKPRKEIYLELKADLKEISTKRLTEKQKKVIDYLFLNKIVSYKKLKELLDINKDVILQLERKELIEIYENIPEKIKKVVLNEEQGKAVEEVVKSKSKVLLHGVTGSGKTEVYLSVVERLNTKVLYLVPEVSLIEQTLSRIYSRFPDLKIEVYHSYLTKSQKVDVWLKAIKGQIDVLVGTRSAFFIPHNYELIIVDEAHDESYYQDGEVVYDINYLADKFPGPVIFGSATPRLDHYLKAKENKMKICKLTKRYGAHLPDVEVINMKKEGKVTYHLSKKLVDEIKNELDNSRSVMLFVRRKGYSLIMCTNCGHVLKCPNCDVALTYHKSNEKLKCHICGYETEVISTCPVCGSIMLLEKGVGTERIEKEIQNLFPARNISRVDTEVIQDYRLFQKILKGLYNGELNILVGTKMITKGLDVPTVNLIGVIDIDAIQSLPDYNSALNLFRLIVQVVGRSGRKEKGKALIQTYEPESLVLEYAVKQDVEGYYDYELNQRRALNYPPFVDIIQVVVYSNEKQSGFKNAEKMVKELRKYNIQILGPTEFFIPKIRNLYLHHFIIKTNEVLEVNQTLNDLLVKFPAKVSIRVNPPSLYFI